MPSESALATLERRTVGGRVSTTHKPRSGRRSIPELLAIRAAVRAGTYEPLRRVDDILDELLADVRGVNPRRAAASAG